METLTKIDYTNYHLSTDVDFIYQKDFIVNKEPDYFSFRKEFFYFTRGECQDYKLCELLMDDHWFIHEKVNKNIEEIFKLTDHNYKDYAHFFIDDYGDLRIYYTTDKISSKYYYGEDEIGKYIIRESDHWGYVASCHWRLKTPDDEGILVSVDNSNMIYYEDEEGYDNSYLDYDICFGKAYLIDFKEIYNI